MNTFLSSTEPLAKLEPNNPWVFKLRATPSSKREIIYYTLYIIVFILFIVSTFHSGALGVWGPIWTQTLTNVVQIRCRLLKIFFSGTTGPLSQTLHKRFWIVAFSQMKEYALFKRDIVFLWFFSFTRPVCFINFAQACLSLETLSQVSDVANDILLNAYISHLDSVTLVTIITYWHLI